jgi:hypothetical protein
MAPANTGSSALHRHTMPLVTRSKFLSSLFPSGVLLPPYRDPLSSLGYMRTGERQHLISRVTPHCGAVVRVSCSPGICRVLVSACRTWECAAFRCSSQAVSVALQEAILDDVISIIRSRHHSFLVVGWFDIKSAAIRIKPSAYHRYQCPGSKFAP